jgi:hypothetical protein
MADVAVEQQAAAPEQQTATIAQHGAAPRFNYRIMAGFEGYQVENIQILRKKFGSSDTAVLRSAVDLLSYVNQLPVETDPSIFLNNYFAHRNGGTNGR